MTRFKRAMRFAFFSATAGVAGYALGVMFAPASGAETRRRWTRRAGDEWGAMSRSCERMFERASAYAKREIDAGIAACAKATHKCD
jgi:gas vesicle protein